MANPDARGSFRPLKCGGWPCHALTPAATRHGDTPAESSNGERDDDCYRHRDPSFTVQIPDEKLADLRRRLAATRWPSKELVDDRSQGVQLRTMQELVRYWTSGYDWRKAEARLNALPQYVTHLDGLDVHFIHVKSRHENALPLIMTHGWPGSVIELLETIGPLTDPTAHGGDAEDAFDLVLPSVPGTVSQPSRLSSDGGPAASRRCGPS